VCFFCIAVFAVVIGAITTAVLDELEQRLATAAEAGSVVRLTDTGTTATLACSVPVPDIAGQPGPQVQMAPVLVTVYKAQKRVRIQVQTHDVTDAEAAAIQERVAAACGLTVVSRSSDQTKNLVHEAAQACDAPAAPSTVVGASRSARLNSRR
jgi:hypothetical protein